MAAVAVATVAETERVVKQPLKSVNLQTWQFFCSAFFTAIFNPFKLPL